MNIPITNMSITDNSTLITLISVPTSLNLLSKIFLSLAEKNVNVDMISQTSPLKGSVNVSFTISDSDFFTAIQALKVFKNTIPSLRIEVNSNNTKISLYGEGMRTVPGTAAKTLEMLSDNNIDIIMISTSEVDISYLFYASDKERVVELFKTLIQNDSNI